MKKIILPLAVLISGTIYAQVGVNTPSPMATMDITAKTTNGSKPEGLIAPRLTGDQIRLANAQYASAQTGTIVYATAADTAPAGKTANITAAGYYYFDGSVWQKVITGTTGDTTNDAWVNSPGNSRVELGTLSDGSTARPAGTEFVARDNGNVGIGTLTPGVRLSVLASGDMNGINLNNSTSAVGTRTRFGIGTGNPSWAALYFTNVSSTVSRFGIGDYVTSNEYLSVNTSGSNIGNVGINNTNPDVSAQLDVSATNKGFLPPRVSLSSSSDAVTIPTPATGLTVYHTGNAGLVAGLYTNIGTGAAPNWVAGTGTQDATNDAWVNDTANGIVKLGSKTDGTARAANTDVVANDSGYLGLGTSNPSSRISITGSGGTNDDIKINSTAVSGGGTGTLLFARSRGTGAVANGDILGSILFRGYDGANEIDTAGILATTNGSTTSGSVPTDLLFSTGSTTFTEKMRVTSSGNVGIGTASPGVKLVVNANGDMNGINLINSTSTNGTRTRFGIGAGNPNYAALYYTNVSSTVGRFGIGDYVTGNEYLSINTSGSNQGNVGIGTTTPDSSAILDVSATNKGVVFPRVALTSATDQTTIPSPAVGLMVYNTGTGGLNNAGYVFWNGSEWRVFNNSSNTSAGPIGIGESITAIYSVPIATASNSSFQLGNYVSANGLTPLPTIDGLEANLVGSDGTYYKPQIFNRNSSSQLLSFQTFATQVNENKTLLNYSLSPGFYLFVDSNDIVFWSTTNAEVITTNVQVQINASTYRWYEFKWWCMEVSSTKKIFIAVKRIA